MVLYTEWGGRGGVDLAGWAMVLYTGWSVVVAGWCVCGGGGGRGLGGGRSRDLAGLEEGVGMLQGCTQTEGTTVMHTVVMKVNARALMFHFLSLRSVSDLHQKLELGSLNDMIQVH